MFLQDRKPLITDKVFRLREILETEGFEAAGRFIDQSTKDPYNTVLQLFYYWLSKEQFHNAAILLWGKYKFTPEPILVQETWQSIKEDSKLIVIGAGSVGKSHNFAIWTLLDWLRDPDYTFVQCLSVTKAHAKTNVFAHIKDLYQNSIIPLPGEAKGESIVPDNKSDKAGILLKAIPQGDQGHGKLRGFHPSPRITPHPIFGRLSRLRLLLDEAEEIPVGIWEGVNNMLVSESENPDYKGQIKIFAATNPKDRLSELGKRCEPIHGWTSIKIDQDHQWISRLGWRIQRLDAARSENVIERKEVYPGMQTWKGFNQYLLLGEENPEYFTMARGWFPEQGVFGIVVPQNLVDSNRGTWIFNGPVVNAAGLDLAFAENGDSIYFAFFKYGYSNSWHDCEGKIHSLSSYRWVMQMEDIFPLQKEKTLELCQSIKAVCESMSIKPDWLACDATGNGKGVFDVLCSIFGPVHGIDYSTAATTLKITEEDQLPSNEVYDGVVTELYFSVKKVLEAGYLKINPRIIDSRLFMELTGRKFYQVGRGKVRVEPKGEFKTRGHKSPDAADAMTLGVHAIRLMAENFSPALVQTSQQVREREWDPSPVDENKFMYFDR